MPLWHWNIFRKKRKGLVPSVVDYNRRFYELTEKSKGKSLRHIAEKLGTCVPGDGPITSITFKDGHAVIKTVPVTEVDNVLEEIKCASINWDFKIQLQNNCKRVKSEPLIGQPLNSKDETPAKITYEKQLSLHNEQINHVVEKFNALMNDKNKELKRMHQNVTKLEGRNKELREMLERLSKDWWVAMTQDCNGNSVLLTDHVNRRRLEKVLETSLPVLYRAYDKNKTSTIYTTLFERLRKQKLANVENKDYSSDPCVRIDKAKQISPYSATQHSANHGHKHISFEEWKKKQLPEKIANIPYADQVSKWMASRTAALYPKKAFVNSLSKKSSMEQSNSINLGKHIDISVTNYLRSFFSNKSDKDTTEEHQLKSTNNATQTTASLDKHLVEVKRGAETNTDTADSSIFMNGLSREISETIDEIVKKAAQQERQFHEKKIAQKNRKACVERLLRLKNYNYDDNQKSHENIRKTDASKRNLCNKVVLPNRPDQGKCKSKSMLEDKAQKVKTIENPVCLMKLCSASPPPCSSSETSRQCSLGNSMTSLSMSVSLNTTPSFSTSKVSDLILTSQDCSAGAKKKPLPSYQISPARHNCSEAAQRIAYSRQKYSALTRLRGQKENKIEKQSKSKQCKVMTKRFERTESYKGNVKMNQKVYKREIATKKNKTIIQSTLQRFQINNRSDILSNSAPQTAVKINLPSPLNKAKQNVTDIADNPTNTDISLNRSEHLKTSASFIVDDNSDIMPGKSDTDVKEDLSLTHDYCSSLAPIQTYSDQSSLSFDCEHDPCKCRPRKRVATSSVLRGGSNIAAGELNSSDFENYTTGSNEKLFTATATGNTASALQNKWFDRMLQKEIVHLLSSSRIPLLENPPITGYHAPLTNNNYSHLKRKHVVQQNTKIEKNDIRIGKSQSDCFSEIPHRVNREVKLLDESYSTDLPMLPCFSTGAMSTYRKQEKPSKVIQEGCITAILPTEEEETQTNLLSTHNFPVNSNVAKRNSDLMDLKDELDENIYSKLDLKTTDECSFATEPLKGTKESCVDGDIKTTGWLRNLINKIPHLTLPVRFSSASQKYDLPFKANDLPLTVGDISLEEENLLSMMKTKKTLSKIPLLVHPCAIPIKLLEKEKQGLLEARGIITSIASERKEEASTASYSSTSVSTSDSDVSFSDSDNALTVTCSGSSSSFSVDGVEDCEVDYYDSKQDSSSYGIMDDFEIMERIIMGQ